MDLEIRQQKATEKINRLIGFGLMKRHIYSKLSMSFQTFDSRLKKNNWKLPELEYIENMKLE